MSHNGKLTNSTGWNAIFSWIKYALTGKRDNTQAVQDTEVSAESLVDLNARVEALEKVLSSLNVDDAEYLSIYKVLQSAKTFSPDRTKTLSAMSQNENGEMSATFAEVQATVVSQNDYMSPESTKTALSTIFGKIWNFFGMLLKSTGTWNGSSDAQIPTTAAVQAKLDEKQGLVGINSSSGDPLKLLNQKGEWVTSPALVNVTSYTSYSSISAILSDGALPYYAHTDGSLVVYLMYVGVSAPTGPGQSVALVFCGVSNGSIYRTSFMDGDSAFGSVTKLSLFDSDRVLGSSNTSAWGGDEYNVPTRGAVFNMLNSVKHSHVEALKIPVNPELYGFVDVGLYDAIHDEPVLTPTTYSETRQTHFIASSDFSALIYTYGVWNPTIAYRCEEFYVNYEWTSAITQSLSLYDFFLNTPASSVYFRHFAITINNYCNYAMTLKIYGGNNHENDVDVYSNIANPTTQLNVAVAAKRVTRIDVRLLFNGVGTYSSKSAVVTVI